MKILKLSLLIGLTSLFTLPVQAETIPCPKTTFIGSGVHFRVTSDQNQAYSFFPDLKRGDKANVSNESHAIKREGNLGCLYRPNPLGGNFVMLWLEAQSAPHLNVSSCIPTGNAFTCK